MANQVRIKLRPDKTVRFPGICVHCSQPAVAFMPIQKRMGRLAQQIDVPFCANCASQLNRRSGAEERLQKIRQLTCGLVFLVMLVLTLILTPAGLSFGIRLLLAVAMAAMAAAAVYWLFRYPLANAALPEKKAVQQAAQITNFSWRTATFSFANDRFAERFQALNEPFPSNDQAQSVPQI